MYKLVRGECSAHMPDRYHAYSCQVVNELIDNKIIKCQTIIVRNVK